MVNLTKLRANLNTACPTMLGVLQCTSNTLPVLRVVPLDAPNCLILVGVLEGVPPSSVFHWQKVVKDAIAMFLREKGAL